MTKTKINGMWVTTSSGEQMWTGTKAQLAAGLADGTIPEGTKVMVTNDYDGGKIPVGVVEAYMGTTAPTGWLLCDGSTFDTTMYPKLYELLGTDTVPDLRECVMVGAGQSTRAILDETGHSHDVYTLGEFKDDQIQNITGRMQGGGSISGAQGAFYDGGTAEAYDAGKYYNHYYLLDASLVARTGTTTHGKQVGVNYIIHAEEA